MALPPEPGSALAALLGGDTATFRLQDTLVPREACAASATTGGDGGAQRALPARRRVPLKHDLYRFDPRQLDAETAGQIGTTATRATRRAASAGATVARRRSVATGVQSTTLGAAPAPGAGTGTAAQLLLDAYGLAQPSPALAAALAALAPADGGSGAVTGGADGPLTSPTRCPVDYGFGRADGAGAAAVIEEASRLVTGQDAIAFFVRHGRGCPVKTVTLVPAAAVAVAAGDGAAAAAAARSRRRPSLLHRGSSLGGGGGGAAGTTTFTAAAAASATGPYDLRLVPPASIKPAVTEHYVMSASGLVHYAPGSPAEFVSLAGWVRARSLYAAVAALPFFATALPRKAFGAWRANVRYARYAATRSALARSLFTWRPAFARAMGAAGATLARISSLPLLDLLPGTSGGGGGARFGSPASFVEAQAAARADALKLVEREIGALHAAVEDVVADVTARAHARPDDGSGDDPYGDAVMVKAREAKTKSMGALRAEAAARAAAQADAAREEAALGRWVRLLDYALVEALAGLVVGNLGRLLDEMTAAGGGSGGGGGSVGGGPPLARAANGLFTTALSFDDDGCAFAPSCADLQGAVEAVVVDTVKAFSSTSRLLYSRPFRELVGGLPTASSQAAGGGGTVSGGGVFGAPTVAALLGQSAPFAAVRAAVHGRLDADFASAAEYGHVFDAVRPVFDYGRTTDREEYRLRDHTPASLARDLARLRSWDGHIDRMRSQHVAGCLFVDSRGLRSELEPVTAGAAETVKAVARDAARARCAAAREGLEGRLKALQALPPVAPVPPVGAPPPAQLEAHARGLSVLANLAEGDGRGADDAEAVEELYRLLAGAGARVPPEDAVGLDDLRALGAAYGDAARRARAWADEQRADMLAALGALEAEAAAQLQGAAAPVPVPVVAGDTDAGEGAAGDDGGAPVAEGPAEAARQLLARCASWRALLVPGGSPTAAGGTRGGPPRVRTTD